MSVFYRLNVIKINVPPLRKRKSDIPMLAEQFLAKYAQEFERDVKKISNEAMEFLMEYTFPGNVRELENIIERAVALVTSNVILSETLPPEVLNGSGRLRPNGQALSETALPDEGIDLEGVVEKLEKDLIVQALEKSKGIKKKAAELLKVSFRSFRYRLEKYGLDNGKGM